MEEMSLISLILAIVVFHLPTQSSSATPKDKKCYANAAECMTGDKLGFSVIRSNSESIASLTEGTKESFCGILSSSKSMPSTWTCMSDHETVECGDCLKSTFITGLEKKIQNLHSLDKHLTGVTPDHLFCSPFFLGLMCALTVFGLLEVVYEIFRWREEKPVDPVCSWCYRTVLLGGLLICYYFGFKKDVEGVKTVI